MTPNLGKDWYTKDGQLKEILSISISLYLLNTSCPPQNLKHSKYISIHKTSINRYTITTFHILEEEILFVSIEQSAKAETLNP